MAMYVKDPSHEGGWSEVSGVSVKLHGSGGSAQPSNPLLQTIPCYPSLDTYSGDDPYSMSPSIYDESTGEYIKGKQYTNVYIFLDANDVPIVLDTNDTSNVYTVLTVDCVGGQQYIYTKHSKDFIWPFLPSGSMSFDATDQELPVSDDSTYSLWDEDTQQSITKPKYDFDHPVYARLIDLLLGGYYGG